MVVRAFSEEVEAGGRTSGRTVFLCKVRGWSGDNALYCLADGGKGKHARVQTHVLRRVQLKKRPDVTVGRKPALPGLNHGRLPAAPPTA